MGEFKKLMNPLFLPVVVFPLRYSASSAVNCFLEEMAQFVTHVAEGEAAPYRAKCYRGWIKAKMCMGGLEGAGKGGRVRNTGECSGFLQGIYRVDLR
jgi:hypothetical protein